MGFPFEIITMLGSTLLSSLLSIWSQSRKAKAEEQKLLITRGEFEMKARKHSLDHGLKDKGFAWTRRIIALTAIFAIVLLPIGIQGFGFLKKEEKFLNGLHFKDL